MDQDFSPVQHTIVLRRVDPDSNIARFYLLTARPSLPSPIAGDHDVSKQVAFELRRAHLQVLPEQRRAGEFAGRTLP